MELFYAKDIAKRLKVLYNTEVQLCPVYEHLSKGCRGWFSEHFKNEADFKEDYGYRNYSFANVVASFLGHPRKMIDFLNICNPWFFWHFDLEMQKSIKILESQGTEKSYLAPECDAQFLKKFCSPMQWSIK